MSNTPRTLYRLGWGWEDVMRNLDVSESNARFLVWKGHAENARFQVKNARRSKQDQARSTAATSQ